MITFAIPAWNRVKPLERTLRSIAAEINAVGMGKIIVCDHGSTDGTWDMLERLRDEMPFLSIRHLARHEDSSFQHNFQFAFSAPDTEWTWMFGDDDLLLPGALKTVIDLIQALPDVQYIRCAEVVRASEKESVTKGTLLQLCHDFGWLDMTGFISCDIVRSERLKSAVNRLSWEGFSRNSFPQSCALLEELADDQALFLDKALVDTQEHELTPENNTRWEEHKIAERYFYVDEAIADLISRRVIPAKLENVFFRYHAYFIWDRLIGNLISDYSNFPDKDHGYLWAHVERFPEFLAEPGATILAKRIREVRSTIETHRKILVELADFASKLNMMVQAHNHNWFPFRYTGEALGVAMPEPPDEAIGVNGLARMIWNAQKRQRERDVKTINDLALKGAKSVLDAAAKAMEALPLADFKA